MDTKAQSTLINYHGGVNYYKEIIAAYNDIGDILKDHCGPHATYMILPTRLGGTTLMDQFTKDGINIVNSLKSNGPLHQHVLRIVSYVGERIDNTCHDGTTTSMMLFCDIAAQLTALLSIIPLEDSAHTRYFLRKALNDYLDECETCITTDMLTVDDFVKQFHTTEEQAIWAIVYHQTLIASKGDTELSYKLAELLTTLPVDLYGQYVLHSSGMETEERFILKQHDYDFEFPGMVANVEDFNYALRSELKLADVTLLVTPNQLIRGNPEAEYLYHYITNPELSANIVKPLVIITPELNDPQLYDAIRKHNIAHPQTKIIALHMQVGTASKLFADAICATAGALPLQSVMNTDANSAFIDGVGIEQRHTRIYISNLYVKTDESLHPFYLDKTLNPFYTRVLTELKQFIANSTSRYDPKKASERMLEFSINCYRYMTSQSLVDLSIGGSSHEYIANLSVAQDAQGAAVSALRDGVILGGHQRLLAHTTVEYQHLVKQQNRDAYQEARLHILYVFGNTLLNTLSTIYFADKTPCDFNTDLDLVEEFISDYTAHTGLDRRWLYLQSEVVNVVNVDQETAPLFTVTSKLLNVDKFLVGNSDQSVVIQPIMGYKELFKRLKELLPKIINTVGLTDPNNS